MIGKIELKSRGWMIHENLLSPLEKELEHAHTERL